MDTIYQVVILVLLLVGVISFSLIKGIARLMPWNAGMVAPRYSAYQRDYIPTTTDRGNGFTTIAFILVLALFYVLYHSSTDSHYGNESVQNIPILEASVPSKVNTTFQYQDSRNESTTEELPEAELPDPIKIELTSLKREKQTDYNYAWQLEAFHDKKAAIKLVQELSSIYPDVQIYDSGSRNARYKVISTLRKTRGDVNVWRKTQIEIEGFITAIN